MRKAYGGWETVFFGGVALVLLLSAGLTSWLSPRLHLRNPRLHYGVEHLAGALLGAFLFTVLVWLAWRFAFRTDPDRWLNKSNAFYLLLIAGVFCLFWLPPLLAGHFDEDDWQLLAAAAIRKVIYLHPGWSWYALDSVDGNFRPLGTVLYFGYLYRFFGLWPLPYFLGLFLVNLLGSLMAFFLVREMGYSKLAGTAASLLYISRSLTYEIRTWTSALGDALVILLCGCMAWALLRAIHRRGLAAFGWHALAWGCFAVATLAKQSAFAAPLIVALLLLVRPGLAETGPLWPRLRAATLGLAVYGATAAAAFFHAKTLTRALTPYPIGFTWGALLRTFSYALWYLGTFELPSKIGWLWVVPSVLGFAIVAGGLAALWEMPRLLGNRPRDEIFCLSAAVASVSLFVVLSNRQAGVLRFHGGVLDEHRTWYRVDALYTRPRKIDRRPALLRTAGDRICRHPPETDGVVTLGRGIRGEPIREARRKRCTKGSPASLRSLRTSGCWCWPTCREIPATIPPWPCWRPPGLETILTYDSRTRTYLSNDLHGARPHNDRSSLNNVGAYNWTVPVDATEAAQMTGHGDVLWLKFEGRQDRRPKMKTDGNQRRGNGQGREAHDGILRKLIMR